MLDTKKKSVIELEEQVAEHESKMHRIEEEYRRKDNERQKKFFYHTRYDTDDVGGRHQKRLIEANFKLEKTPTYVRQKTDESNYSNTRINVAAATADARAAELRVKDLERELE